MDCPYLNTTRSGFAERLATSPSGGCLTRRGQTQPINAEHGPARAGPSPGRLSRGPRSRGGAPHTYPRTTGEEKLPGVRGAAHKPHGARRGARSRPGRPLTSHRPTPGTLAWALPDRNGPSMAGPRGKASGQHTATPGKRPGPPRAQGSSR